MLRRVLANILDNAVKYSDKQGEIIVTAFVKDGGVVIRVQDFGCGIRHEDRDKVFDKFFRGNNPAARYKGGTGLGLAIAKASWMLTGAEYGATRKSAKVRHSAFSSPYPHDAEMGRQQGCNKK